MSARLRETARVHAVTGRPRADRPRGLTRPERMRAMRPNRRLRCPRGPEPPSWAKHLVCGGVRIERASRDAVDKLFHLNAADPRFNLLHQAIDQNRPQLRRGARAATGG